MAIRYTGRANPLVIDGKAYKPGDVVPLSAREAARMAARSRLHTFETTDGGRDVLDAATAPKPDKK